MAKLIVTGAENVFGVIQSPLFWWAKIDFHNQVSIRISEIQPAAVSEDQDRKVPGHKSIF